MDSEIIEYRRQTIKGRFKITRRFCKFYLNKFRPLTKLEERDQRQARDMYRSYIFVGAVGFGFMSLKYRKMRFSMMEAHEAPRDYQMLNKVLTDSGMAFTGYMMAHYLSCDYIYKHRQYVIERMHCERQNNFDRDTYDLGVKIENADGTQTEENRLLDEYIFAQYVSQSDADITGEWEQPQELKEDIEIKKERLEAYHAKQNKKRKEEEQDGYDDEEAAMLLKLQNIHKEFENTKKKKD